MKIPIVIRVLGTVSKGFVQGLEDLEISSEHPNGCIIKISQNTEKSLGEVRSLPFTQTPVKTPQLKLVLKSLKLVVV